MTVLRSRVLCALGALAVLAASATPPAQSHEGHDHGEQKAPPANVLPRGATASDAFELVAVADQGALVLYLDRFATNEPVTGATLEVETPSGPAKAEPVGGAYRLPAPWLEKGGHFDLIVTVSAGDASDILTLTLDVPPAAEAPPTSMSSRSQFVASMDRTVLVAAISFIGGLLVAGMLLRRRTPKAALVLLLVLAGVPSWAHEGEDHPAPANAGANASGELAQRLPDGSVFVPKSVQRIFALRTEVTTRNAHRRTIALPGRIIADPNASGYVQSAVGGRLSPPPGGFPRLGTRVKEGDILGYVTPPLQAIDVSDMRQRQGELDQQISIVERRLARQEQLVPSGVVSRVALDETRLELQGLRERRAAIEKVRREPEALIAPVSGVVAEGSAVAGQIVQPSFLIFHIIDPAQLWVEALSFDVIEPTQRATATMEGGKSLRLSHRGSGFADRNQSVPVHFAIEGNAAGLRAGQFVTVLVAAGAARSAIALPRASLVRGGNGQNFVYEHVAPERFVARAVRTEALDGEHVLIAAGIEEGLRIVTQGAELLGQVR